MKVSEIHDINLKKALERAEYALRESECVEGVLIFGSIARKQYDSYSDVDLMVMIGQDSCLESLKVHVSRKFSDSVMMEKDGKIILFPPGLPKVELYIFHSSEADEAKKLFLGSKITDPHDTIMFARTGYPHHHVEFCNFIRIHDLFPLLFPTISRSCRTFSKTEYPIPASSSNVSTPPLAAIESRNFSMYSPFLSPEATS